jgi:hypothetical protein
MSKSGFTDHSRRARIAFALLSAGLLGLGVSPAAFASLARSAYRTHNLCTAPRPGSAACLGIRLVAASLTPAQLESAAAKQAAEAAAGVTPAVQNKTPLEGGLTPQKLHSAYSLPTETLSGSGQTVAVVDAYNDPTAEADLAAYDKQFGLPACTSANGCFRKINEEGRTSPLPATEGGWATEISLDVQMAHAICQNCHVLLVEAANPSFAALGAAVEAAVKAGATVISNSYGGAEEAEDSSYNGPYDHPGVVITASAGDCGYFNEDGCNEAEAANFPASSPDVVAVGGTTLTEAEGAWSSTVWAGGGSGCSAVFTAPAWQSHLSNFSLTACGSGRSVADVAAVANPYTGVDVYDTTPTPEHYPTGWGVWGGTSVASPVVASEYALAGGAHGVEYPASTLYSHIGNSSALYDVVSGSNGSCTEATSCHAAAGYDGPTGVGSPIGLSAFTPAASPADEQLPSISGTAEQDGTLTVSHGKWSNSPSSYSERWAVCNSSGSSCTEIAGASGQSYTIPPSDLGLTIRVQESAMNASGSGAPALSAQTATVAANVPTITSFTPTSGLTGSSVTITGTGFTGASAVQFDGTAASSFTVKSSTQIEATVADGTLVGDIVVTTPVKSATSKAEFTPTLSLKSFTPAGGEPGKVVTITGLGFNSSSSVSFDGVPAASVTLVSSTKLKATVPASASKGAITVTNTSAPSGTVASASNFNVT